MTIPTEQYSALMQQGQEAVRDAVDSWTQAVKDAVTQVPAIPAAYDADKVIDQVFDFAEKLLEVQRDFAKNLIKSSASAVESVTQAAPQPAPKTTTTEPK
jgi:acetyl-CoA carboxylase carboxyltransferase component